MQILVLSGSRNRQGQTARAIDAICKGAEAGGATTEVVFLTELSLERCRQCEADGWGICRREGRCIIEDDFAATVDRMEAADALVFANPVYFGDLSDSMKTFLDRYRRTQFPRMVASGRGPGPMMGGGGTPTIALCYAGGSGNGTTSSAANMERILQTCGLDVVDVIPARRQNIENKLPILELTGKWLATKPTSGPPFVPPR